MWWRFRRHKAALVASGFILALYAVALFAQFLAVSDPAIGEINHAFMAPQTIKWFDGGFSPHVCPIASWRDPFTLKKKHTTVCGELLVVDGPKSATDELPNPGHEIFLSAARALDPDIQVGQDLKGENIPVSFFFRGFEYKVLGIITTRRHLFGVADVESRPAVFLMGTDKLGRDLYSRMIYGTRLSMSIGLVGVTISLFLGIGLGGFSGFYGGPIDTVIQRVIEILRSIPTIPLWIALAAAVPRDWSPARIFFSITIIISLISWTELGRVVRGRFLALREEEFVTAARLSGATDLRIIFRHMVPSFTSHVIAAASLAIPAMIIAETALSFLGLGLRAPAISWGVLLKQAQNIQAVAIYPWLMFPALPVIVAVLSFNFMGDGLRDAADPYG